MAEKCTDYTRCGCDPMCKTENLGRTSELSAWSEGTCKKGENCMNRWFGISGWELKTPWPQVRFIFDGVTYKWSGWFGCQLESWEWNVLPAGTKRRLDFGYGKPKVELTIYTTKREGFKVRTTWAISDSGTHDEHSARIHELKRALASLV